MLYIVGTMMRWSSWVARLVQSRALVAKQRLPGINLALRQWHWCALGAFNDRASTVWERTMSVANIREQLRERTKVNRLLALCHMTGGRESWWVETYVRQ
jgi:hypothetical protein